MKESYAATWFVLADGEHARVVVPAPHRQFRELRALDSVMAHKRAAALATDRPGRSFESATPTRHAIEPRTDPHQAAKQDFLRFLADDLAGAAREGAYDRLVLVAPPAALHELRESLGREVAAKVVATVAKDLVKTPVAALATHLEAYWTAPAAATD